MLWAFSLRCMLTVLFSLSSVYANWICYNFLLYNLAIIYCYKFAVELNISWTHLMLVLNEKYFRHEYVDCYMGPCITHLQAIIMYYLRKFTYKEKGLFWFTRFGDYSPKWSRPNMGVCGSWWGAHGKENCSLSRSKNKGRVEFHNAPQNTSLVT